MYIYMYMIWFALNRRFKGSVQNQTSPDRACVEYVEVLLRRFGGCANHLMLHACDHTVCIYVQIYTLRTEYLQLCPAFVAAL